MYQILILSIALFFSGCSEYKKENTFEKVKSFSVNKDFEPSGITFCKNTLFSVSDEGTLMSINKNNVIKYYKIKDEGDYEGITCHKDKLYLAEEGKDNIIEINLQGKILNEFNIDRKYNGEKVISKKGNGLESLAFFKEDIDNLYFFTSNQSNEFSGNDKSAIMVIKINKNSKKAKINKYFPLKIKDISGILYQDGLVYFISDKKDKLYLADENLNIFKEYNLFGDAQEGIFIKDNNIYIADDEGFILKAKIKKSLY